MVENPLAGVMPSMNLGGTLSASVTLAFWLFVTVIIVGIIIFVWWLLSFKHTVVIKQKIGRPIEMVSGKYYESTAPDKGIIDKVKGIFKKELPTIKKEEEQKVVIEGKEITIIPYLASVYKAKFVTKKKVRYLILQFNKLKLKIPDQVYQNITHKGKRYIELTQISEHIFAPTVLTENETGKHIYIYDESYFDWVVNDIEKDHQKYMTKDFWSQYGNWIMSAGLLVIIMVIIVVTLRYSKDIISATTPLVSALTEAADKFAQAMQTQSIQ